MLCLLFAGGCRRLNSRYTSHVNLPEGVCVITAITVFDGPVRIHDFGVSQSIGHLNALVFETCVLLHVETWKPEGASRPGACPA